MGHKLPCTVAIKLDLVKKGTNSSSLARRDSGNYKLTETIWSTAYFPKANDKQRICCPLNSTHAWLLIGGFNC
jgi:hypothetical protein